MAVTCTICDMFDLDKYRGLENLNSSLLTV